MITCGENKIVCHFTFELFTDETNTFNVNITQAFLQQAIRFSLQLSEIKRSLDGDFR